MLGGGDSGAQPTAATAMVVITTANTVAFLFIVVALARLEGPCRLDAAAARHPTSARARPLSAAGTARRRYSST